MSPGIKVHRLEFHNKDIMNRIDLSIDKTLVMGVLNITPDSFSDGGLFFEPEDAVEQGLKMVDEGADILDIGGESSRPGSEPVTMKEESNRVLPVLRELAKQIKIPISIDTYKSEVARQALDEGASIVNDITALNGDPQMVHVIKETKCETILMHMQGTPKTMQEKPTYQNVILDIKIFFQNQIQKALDIGIQKNQVMIDPGIGFGKTIEHNLEILRRLVEFNDLGYPLVVGVSRKSFIGKILDLPMHQRLEGSLAAAAIAVWNGAKIIRVHDVQETIRITRIVDAIKKADAQC